MFTSSKEEYKSAYRDQRIYMGHNRHKSAMYGNPPSVWANCAAINTYSWRNQGESVGYHIGRYKSGKIDSKYAAKCIIIQYQYNTPKLP